MYKKLQILAVSAMATWMCLVAGLGVKVSMADTTRPTFYAVADHAVREAVICRREAVEANIVMEQAVDEESEEAEPALPEADIRLIALVTMAEAEGECEEGKRLVIDTILNRVDSNEFPDSVRDVIYQKNQFTSMWNGRVDQVEATEEVCQLVREELNVRTNTDVVFFTAKRYGKFGTPLFRVGNHYFSGH